MTRREAIAISLASAFAFGAEDKWISVAGPAKNGAGRSYSPEALMKMHAALPGSKVFAQPGAEDYPNLSSLIGVVTAARYIGGIIQVRIRWMDGGKPTEISHACPWGKGLVENGVVRGSDYEFKNLTVSPLGSYFYEATPV